MIEPTDAFAAALDALGEQIRKDALEAEPLVTGALLADWQPGDEISYGYHEVGYHEVGYHSPTEDQRREQMAILKQRHDQGFRKTLPGF